MAKHTGRTSRALLSSMALPNQASRCQSACIDKHGDCRPLDPPSKDRSTWQGLMQLVCLPAGDALLAIQRSLNGQRLQGWGVGSNYCTGWQGVTCIDNRVANLYALTLSRGVDDGVLAKHCFAELDRPVSSLADPTTVQLRLLKIKEACVLGTESLYLWQVATRFWTFWDPATSPHQFNTAGELVSPALSIL